MNPDRTKSWHLSNWTLAELRYELAYQTPSDGVMASWGPGQCGHDARGSGYCAGCLRREIERRERAA